MEFWGAEVKAGKPITVKPDEDCLIHVSQASLDVKGKKGESAVLYVTVDGKKLVIGTLSNENIPQISFDLVFEKEFELSHSLEKASVHFIGYKSPNINQDEGEYSCGEEEEEEVEVPAAVTATGNSGACVPNVVKAALEPKAKPDIVKHEADETEDDDSDDQDESKEGKQKIHKEKSEENDEDEKIVLKNEIKELKSSMQELLADMKKLITKADLLEAKETPKKKVEVIRTGCAFECKEARGCKEDTIFVKGFGKSRPRGEIKSALSSIFGACGKVTRVFVPVDCSTHDPLGFAFIDLENKEDVDEALELNGSCMEGMELEVMMAKDKGQFFFSGSHLIYGGGGCNAKRNFLPFETHTEKNPWFNNLSTDP